MIDNLKPEATARMAKSIESLKQELSKLRTGRAHPSLLDHVMVSYYGNEMPLNQVAAITVEDARTLKIVAHDKTLSAAIEKAIMTSNLGLNPTTAGLVIRINLPPLTEQRRKELAKLAGKYAEAARIAARNVRRDGMDNLKTDENDAHIRVPLHENERRRDGHFGTVVPAHAVYGDSNSHPIIGKRKGRRFPATGTGLPDSEELLARTFGNFLATVVARRADMMAQVNFTGRRLNSQRRIGQKIVRTVHATLGRGLLVLLNGHKLLHLSNSLCFAFKSLKHRKRRDSPASLPRIRQCTTFVTWR